ncbi:MAG: FAD-dependent oxidoreductase [Clostridiales bacterium]|jgi:thioredoxin reductase (NADPH)|nr:FAD-dependent oxidoreductase [Clostridiales bacterium]
MYDAIIIGAGTAGMTAALYLRRAGKRVLIFERETIGGQIVYSPKIENYPAIRSISGADYAGELFSQVEAHGADFEFSDVTAIKTDIRDAESARSDLIVIGAVTDGGEKKEFKKTEKQDKIEKKTFSVFADAKEFKAKSLIIASGVKHRRLGLERETELSGCGVSYCAVCDGAFFKGKNVAVAGGGSAALTDALFLSDTSKLVFLIHRREQFRGEKKLTEILSEKKNVTFVLNSEISELIGENTLSALKILNKSTGGISVLPVDGLFIAVGYVPSNAVFGGIADLDADGYIIAGENCRTSESGVFAAGDCRTKEVRQLSTAAADGAVAAVEVCKFLA